MRHAHMLLRLLVEPGLPPEVGDLQWDVLLRLSSGNGALVRTAEQLAAHGIHPPATFDSAVRRQRERTVAVMDLVRRISRACVEQRLEFVFLKAFRHYPDPGRDVDLLLLSRSTSADTRILEGLSASPVPRCLESRLAGAISYAIPGCPLLLDIRHGRVGRVGEHTVYADVIVRNRRPTTIEGTQFFTTSVEDEMVLDGMQRAYGHRPVALSQIARTISCARRNDLDWDYVIRTARQIGVFPGLCRFLACVDDLHRGVFGDVLLRGTLRRTLALEAWGGGRFRDGGYHIATLSACGKLYARKLFDVLRAGNWAGAARVCLVPLVGAAGSARRVARSGIRRRLSFSHSTLRWRLELGS